MKYFDMQVVSARAAVPQIEAQVMAVVHKMLGPLISADQPLMEAGLDSLGAVELRTSLQATFALDLPATLTFDFPSVTAISKYIATQALPPAAPGPQQVIAYLVIANSSIAIQLDQIIARYLNNYCYMR